MTEVLSAMRARLTLHLMPQITSQDISLLPQTPPEVTRRIAQQLAPLPSMSTHAAGDLARRPTFALYTLGCKVNQYDSHQISRALTQRGFERVAFRERADLYVIDTCTVTHEADRKSRKAAGRARRNNADAVVAVTGCAAAYAREQFQRVAPDALVLDNSRKWELPDLAIEALHARRDWAESYALWREQSGSEPQPFATRERAVLKIQDGCNHRCAFCIIPTVRGASVLKSRDEAMREARQMVREGARELTITGVSMGDWSRGDWSRGDSRGNVRGDSAQNSYDSNGANISIADSIDVSVTSENATSAITANATFTANATLRNPDAQSEAGNWENEAVMRLEAQVGQERRGNAALCSLLRAVATIEGLERVRVSSLDPADVDDAFLRAVAQTPKVCPHIHLALQGGSAQTLRRMRRRYTPQVFLRAARRWREIRPDGALTTDIIVGFPGETPEDFECSMQIAREARFSAIHVFPYSPREGTVAATLPDHVAPVEQARRVDALLALARELSGEYASQFIGSEVPVLLEGAPHETGCSEGFIEGLTPHYLKARVQLPLDFMDDHAFQAGDIVWMRAQSWRDDALHGEWLAQQR